MLIEIGKILCAWIGVANRGNLGFIQRRVRFGGTDNPVCLYQITELHCLIPIYIFVDVKHPDTLYVFCHDHKMFVRSDTLNPTHLLREEVFHL